jgi:2-succinyl-5-enolpyruvyl-6-hydroxy-3-cyclohexene-1-carboxylate synthase
MSSHSHAPDPAARSEGGASRPTEGARSRTQAAYALLAAFVDELARCGMRDACTSPGSRCAPLVLTLARERRLRCHSHIDERCAGFFALGLAKASGVPVAVACTSGTAVAELLPAVVEAHEARVPLIVLSADRPPELRESGAGQAIDQLGLFGGFAKWFFDVGTHEHAGSERVRWMRTLACRAFGTACSGRPGAVHLNFALREPLVPEQPPGPPEGGRADGRPLLTIRRARPIDPDDARSLAVPVGNSRRGVVVAGRHERDTPLGEAAAEFCERAGWPLLADPLSRARRGDAAVAHYDALLRDPSFLARAKPDLVVRVGDLPTSKPLRAWLAGMPDVPQAALDPEGAWQDPDATLCRHFALEPATVLPSLDAPSTDPDWLATWRSADERAAEAILGTLAGDGREPASREPGTAADQARGSSEPGAATRQARGLSEPAVAHELGVLLGAEATLFVASSMPVRDIETFWPAREDPPRVLCNRGANGIDGTVSSAFGAAAADQGRPVVLLIGDVALAHDIGGLLAASRLSLKLTIVLVNNAGGGIFDFLAVSRTPMAREQVGNEQDEASQLARSAGERDSSDKDIYTRHVATPTGLDFARAAELYGLTHERADSLAAFRSALERTLDQAQPGIVEVQTDRAENVALHERVWSAVSQALS